MWPLFLVLATLSVMLFSAFKRGVTPTVDAPTKGEPTGDGETSWLGFVVRASLVGATALVLLALWSLSMAGYLRLAIVLALVGGFVLSYYSREPNDR